MNNKKTLLNKGKMSIIKLEELYVFLSETENIMNFSIGDKIAHPMHGAGIIDSIMQETVDGRLREYYVIKLPSGGMLVKVPSDSCSSVGIRPIVGREAVDELFEKIPSLDITMTQNWNKRYRENMERIKSGDLLEVAAVAKGLAQREREKGLSTGERKMLHSAMQILVSEIVLACSASCDEVELRLCSAFNEVCEAV